MKRFIQNQRGFTLLEMAAVLLIISLLLLVLIPTMTSGKDQAKGVSCEANIRVIRSEVNLYYAKEKKYPESLQTINRGTAEKPNELACDQETYTYDAKTGELTKAK
ncbi:MULTISPECIES: prepilin-type N-terminal cleavage/methylation domain-containing protein [Exiguobacterium]|uniref:competence type IV pilus major pilin ComGC n=1 Tax=Exiguobacterium TaxID=33986 RepID=UPI00047BAA3D|nr:MULTISPECIES: prepilin-type N-terminal cleavage/methylation domain-containing protein [Exiguobacterium]MCK2157952.1 prepilin-type N-terminal cleavage/methylation domain-containing protein [Exiguobacterium sp. 17-1]